MNTINFVLKILKVSKGNNRNIFKLPEFKMSSSTTSNPNPNQHHIERFKKYFEPGDQSKSLRDRAWDYVDEVFTNPVPYAGQEKAVIMLVGCPMSGKTTFARSLHTTLKKAVMMSRDFIRTNPQGVYTFDANKEHKVYTKFFTQLEELYNNKSWNIIIVDDTNCSKKQIIELLAFLEALEANIIPVVFEAPPKKMIESRMKTDNKGLDLEHVWKEAQGIYDLGELLFSVYNPIFYKQPKFEECKDSESFNANAIEEQYFAIVEVHKTLLSFKPSVPVQSMLFTPRVLPSFKRAIFNVIRQLADEKEELRQQLASTSPAAKRVRKTPKSDEEEKEKDKV